MDLKIKRKKRVNKGKNLLKKNKILSKKKSAKAHKSVSFGSGLWKTFWEKIAKKWEIRAERKMQWKRKGSEKKAERACFFVKNNK